MIRPVLIEDEPVQGRSEAEPVRVALTRLVLDQSAHWGRRGSFPPLRELVRCFVSKRGVRTGGVKFRARFRPARIEKAPDAWWYPSTRHGICHGSFPRRRSPSACRARCALCRSFSRWPCQEMATGYLRTEVTATVAGLLNLRMALSGTRIMRRLGKLVSTSSTWHCLAPNSQPFHQAAKGVRVNLEDGSRAVGSADHPAGSLEHSQNMLALYFFE